VNPIPPLVALTCLHQDSETLIDWVEYTANLDPHERFERLAEVGVRLYQRIWQAFPDACAEWLGWYPAPPGGRLTLPPSDSPLDPDDQVFHVTMMIAWRPEIRALADRLEARGYAPTPYRVSSLPMRYLKALEGGFPRHFPIWVSASRAGREPANWIHDDDTYFPDLDLGGEIPGKEPWQG
jgi:hypothetical protein